MLRRLLIVLTLLLSLTLILMLAAPAGAAQPPEPTYNLAVVDGDPGEWNTADPLLDPHSDYFAALYLAGKPDREVLADVYLRYDCATGQLWVLMLTRPGITVFMTNPEAYLKLNGVVQVDNLSGNDGTPPDFQFIENAAGEVVGWEATALVPAGSYADLNIHTNVLWGGSQTAQVANRAIALLLNCDSCNERAIQGIVFYDEDKNELYDPYPAGFDEPMAAVEVCLVSTANTALAPTCTMTDAVGYYLFDNLMPGTYEVAQIAVESYILVTEPYTVLLYGACEPAMDCDFANQVQSTPTAVILTDVGPVASSALPISLGALLLTLALLTGRWLRRRRH